MLEVVADVGVAGLELAGGVVDVVAALGDGEREDAGGGGGHALEDGFAVFGGEEIVDERADDARGLSGGGALDEGVEEVLGAEGVAHTGVDGEDADAALAPARLVGEGEEIVEIEGLVGAVEAADAEVDGVLFKSGAVVPGNLYLRW